MMLSHCELLCVVQGIREFAKRQGQKNRPLEKVKSAQSVYASNTVSTPQEIYGKTHFKMSEITSAKTKNPQDEIFCHLNIRYTPVNVCQLVIE